MPFRKTHSTTALPWRKQEQQLASDTLSASVDLEDIIDDFDELSRNQSTGSFSNIQFQTYFSLSGTVRDQDTASFHTALQDGFSLNQLDTSNSNTQNQLPYSEDLLWANDDLDAERNSMLPPTNFQVSWDDLVYKIKPKITISSLWYDLEQNFKTYFSSSLQLLNSKRNNNGNSYSTRVDQLYKKEPVTIIQQISGSFKSGELTAVMGPSGAGKTSLLNFLSRRREEGYTGQLYVDNTHRKLKISTIPQNDYLPEYLTVSENLMFASRLKNTQPNYDHEKNIERVSSLLGLDDCLGTRTKKISGGQHKRLSIAQELLSRPDILVLDEPTSGLDSLTCYKTLSVLKNLVKSSSRKLIDPIAIVVTIHQPQQEVFDIFDKVYVMANGGIAIYDGPPERCTQFIEKHSGIQIPSQDYNPASFLIEIASGEYGLEPIKSLERQVQLEFARSRKEYKNHFSVSNVRNKNNIQEFQSNQASQKNLEQSKNSVGINIDVDETAAISTQEDEDVSKFEAKNLKVMSSSSSFRDKRNRKTFLYIDQRIAKGSSMNKGNFWLKTRILSERYWISITRDPKQLIARIIFHIFLPICLSLMMGTEPGGANACPRFNAQYELKELVKDDNQTSNDVQHELLYTLENIALLYVLIYALSSANIAATTLSFTLDMQSSLKEFHNGWYSMPAYITARFITDLPVEVCLPILTLVIAYPLSGQVTGNGLADSYRIIISSVAMILGSMVGATLGMIFGALYVGYVSTALFASQGATLPLVFISGFVVRTKNMSKLVYALSHFSFYRHILEITVIARYGFGVCSCDPKSITGHDAQLIGVPDRLRAFTQYWMSAYGSTQDSTTVEESSASKLVGNSTGALEEQDIFQLFAKQISLYNTNGVEVKSCDDVKPFQLYDLTLSETDLPASFLALIILLVLIRFLLLLVVKLVIHFRTSL